MIFLPTGKRLRSWFLCTQSWQDHAGCCKPVAFTGHVIWSQGWAVLASIYMGWSTTILVIFDHIMTPFKNAWLHLLPWILLGQYCIRSQTWWDNKNTCGIMHSYFNPTLNLCPWRDSSCHLAEIDDNALGTSWGDLKNENFKGDWCHFKLT